MSKNEFISANKYFKPLAKQAIEDKKWAGWDMLQSLTESNKYIFIHYFSSPKQYEKFNGAFDSDVVEKLGLKSPNWDAFEWKTTAPMEIYKLFQLQMVIQKSNIGLKMILNLTIAKNLSITINYGVN